MAQVNQARRRVREGERIAVIAAELGIDHSVAWRMITGRTYPGASEPPVTSATLRQRKRTSGLDHVIHELHDRYVKDGLTLAELSAEIGCAKVTLREAFAKHGLKRRLRGSMPPILSVAIVAHCRNQHYLNGVSLAELARHYGVAQETMRDAVRWRTWKHAGGFRPNSAEVDDKSPCVCGVLTAHASGFCAYCRAGR